MQPPAYSCYHITVTLCFTCWTPCTQDPNASVHTGSQAGACHSQAELHSSSMWPSLNSRKWCQMLGRGFLQRAATGGGEGRQYCVFQRNEIQKCTLRAGVPSNTPNTGHSGQPEAWGDGIMRDQAHSPSPGPQDAYWTQQQDISYVLQVLLHLWWIWAKKHT